MAADLVLIPVETSYLGVSGLIELQRTIEVLCRRRKNNPVLVGDPGVGKTAMAEGLATRLLQDTMNGALADAEVFALDAAALAVEKNMMVILLMFITVVAIFCVMNTLIVLTVQKTDEDMKQVFEDTAGMPVKYEMLSCNPWRQNLLVADRYQNGRVLLAGDAVHLVIPTGGLGMNSGVGDAIDLAWKLEAVLKGWGGPNMIGSYEFERRQIGDRNVGASRYATLGRRRWRSSIIRRATSSSPATNAPNDIDMPASWVTTPPTRC